MRKDTQSSAISVSAVRWILVCGSVLLSLTGCGRKTPSDAEKGRTGTSAGNEGRPAWVAEDHSLTETEYVKLGMPPVQQPWGPNECAAAASVLKTLAAKDPTLLPRYESNASGGVFTKICFQDVLDTLGNARTSVNLRMGSFVGSAQAASDLLKTYGNPTSDGKVFDEEIVELEGFLLRLIPIVRTLSKEFLDSLPADDPRMKVRLDGLANMKKGMVQMVQGAIVTLGDRDHCRTRARIRLARCLKVSVPDSLRWLDPSLRTEVEGRVAGLVRSETDAALRSELELLLDAVRSAN